MLLCRYDNGRLALPQLRPPFYGMLMFQMAVRDGSRLMGGALSGASSPDNYKWLKVWPLQDIKTKELRWGVGGWGVRFRGFRVRFRGSGVGFWVVGVRSRCVCSKVWPLQDIKTNQLR